MKKLLLLMIVILTLFIMSSCEKYSAAPDVIVDFWTPLGAIYSDTTNAYFVIDTATMYVTNGVDAEMDYITVDYYIGGNLVFSDSTQQGCPFYLRAGYENDQEALSVSDTLTGCPVYIKPGLKLLFANDTLQTVMARIIMHGHAYYNDSIKFETFFDVALLKNMNNNTQEVEPPSLNISWWTPNEKIYTAGDSLEETLRIDTLEFSIQNNVDAVIDYFYVRYFDENGQLLVDDSDRHQSVGLNVTAGANYKLIDYDLYVKPGIDKLFQDSLSYVKAKVTIHAYAQDDSTKVSTEDFDIILRK